MSLNIRQRLAFDLFKHKDITIEQAYKLADEFLSFNSNQEQKIVSSIAEKKESIEDDYSDCDDVFQNTVDYEFTARTCRIIREQGIKYVGDLVQYNPIDLLRQHGFGKKSYDEVHDVLNSLGLDFGIDREQMKTYNPDTDGKKYKIKHLRNWRSRYCKQYSKEKSETEKHRLQASIDRIDKELNELDL